MAKEKFKDWSKQDLIKEIKKLKKRKKYGIVWEDKPEKVVLLCKEKLPVLKEVRNKEIKTDEKKPINILIEGDNYHALSVLNYTHRGKIDVIYIDPPYNTGNKDFIFNDRYVDKEDCYRHSKWLSFMAKRLKLARQLLKLKGVMFFSIDDNESYQLKLLCDEIFGEKNFIASYIWESRSGKGATAKHVANLHEYVLCYARNINNVKLKDDFRETKGGNYEDEKSEYRREQLRQWGQGDRREDRPTMFYAVKAPDSTEVYPIKDDGSEGRWRVSKKTMNKLIIEGDVDFVFDGKRYQLYRKIRAGRITRTAMGTLIFGVGTSSTGTKELKSFFTNKVFDTTKPLGLIKHLINLADAEKNAIILDFMAGSGTTGQAVLDLNKEDVRNRKFILCTNNENKICTDVCYPRIKKTIKGYNNLKRAKVEGLGGNLKYFKTDFVDAEPTDRNKKKLVDESTEMLCLKEDCFNEVKSRKYFKIFKDSKGKLLGIVYDDEGIESLKKEIKKTKKKFVVYVFSLDESAREEEFEDIIELVDLKPIPEVILNVYRRIFK